MPYNAHQDRPAECATQGRSVEEIKALLAGSLDYGGTMARGPTEAQLARTQTFPTTSQQVGGAWALLHGLSHVAVRVGPIHITRDMFHKRPSR